MQRVNLSAGGDAGKKDVLYLVPYNQEDGQAGEFTNRFALAVQMTGKGLPAYGRLFCLLPDRFSLYILSQGAFFTLSPKSFVFAVCVEHGDAGQHCNYLFRRFGMTANGSSSSYFVSIGLFLLVLVIPAITSADCLKDRYGEVYCGAGRCLVDHNGIVLCSRYYDGDAERTSDGQVLCGKGQCVKRSDGGVFCSTEIGGAALLDSRGRARCYGQCEPATGELCENTRAGSAGN